MADATPEASISDADVDFFLANGYLKVPGFLRSDELTALQEETKARIDYATAEVRDEPGIRYGGSTVSDKQVLARVEYPSDWSMAGRALMGNPKLLRLVEKISGPDFLAMGDGCVLKLPGEGVAVDWHRDNGDIWGGQPPNYNVDVYLDDATEENCVWAIPGSNRWTKKEADVYQGKPCVPSEEPAAVSCTMKAGDALVHDARVIHGSETTTCDTLRRTIYMWFYSLDAVDSMETVPGFYGKRWRYLQQCIEARAESSFGTGEVPYNYRANIDHEIPDEVSFQYWEHGLWKETVPAEDE